MPMDHEDIIKFKSLYLQTSWGYLNMLLKNMAFLQKGKAAESVIDGSHLASHSLKSQSLLMGYDQVGKLSELIEKIFKKTKEKSFTLDPKTLDTILAGLNKIQLSLTQIADNGDEAEMNEEISNLEAVIKQPE